MTWIKLTPETNESELRSRIIRPSNAGIAQTSDNLDEQENNEEEHPGAIGHEHDVHLPQEKCEASEGSRWWRHRVKCGSRSAATLVFLPLMLGRVAFSSSCSCSSLFERRSARFFATHTRFAVPDTTPSPNETSARLPRYLRRRAQFASASPEPTRTSPAFPHHVANSNATKSSASVKVGRDGQPMKLLEPHVLSSRLKKLCDKGKIDDAIAMLKKAPLDAQNTPVWNTLIWECMKSNRYNTAYALFTDMKRRGLSPTMRTYQTMLTGLSRITEWYKHSKQLSHAHQLYDYYQNHVQSMRKEDPRNPELTVTPLASYIKILGDAGEHQKIFDVYHDMDSQGPLAADEFIYTSMFLAISKFKSTARSSSPGVTDAKLLWKQTLKASERPGGFTIDAPLVTAAISALSCGRQTEQALAFQLVRDYFGLTKPGDAFVTPKFPLTPQALIAALMLCNITHKPSVCIHYFQQLTAGRTKLQGVDLLDRGQLEEVLKAHVALSAMGMAGQAAEALATLEWMLKQEILGPNGPRIRPGKSTFDLVLMACWRGVDWDSASRTFELMTGLRVRDFLNETSAQKPRLEKRSVGRNLIPDAESMSSMLRTAHDSRSKLNAKQCLRIMDYVGADKLFEEASGNKRQVKHQEFYQAKLASAIFNMIEFILGKTSKEGNVKASDLTATERTRWIELKKQALAVVRRTGSGHIPPALEQDIKPVTTSDSFIEYELVPRTRATPYSQ